MAGSILTDASAWQLGEGSIGMSPSKRTADFGWVYGGHTREGGEGCVLRLWHSIAVACVVFGLGEMCAELLGTREGNTEGGRLRLEQAIVLLELALGDHLS